MVRLNIVCKLLTYGGGYLTNHLYKHKEVLGI